MLLNAQDITKTHGLTTLFRSVCMSIAEGERVGFIGPNGAGKSTLLKILAGLEQTDEGVVSSAKGTKAVYVPQQDEFDDVVPGHPAPTARDIVAYAALLGGGHIHDQYEAEILADGIMDRMGFDEQHSHSVPQRLSGGWRKRLSVARALASAGGEPDLLLLDEPTNHLDVEGIEWLESFVTRASGGKAQFASVFVTHDRTFLENVATRIVELSRAYPLGTLSVSGNYTEFLRRKEEFLAGQSKAQASLANQVRKDLAWLARGAKARRTKAKGRIDASYERIGELAEIKDRNSAAAGGAARVELVGTDRRTRKFIAATGISKSMGGRILFKDVDVAVGVGDCLGLLGPNGSGKTTLINVITGQLPSDSGVIKRSDPEPKVVVFSQHRQDFDPNTSLREALSSVGDQVRYRGAPMHITAWSRRFLFRDEQLDQPVKSLSGGELARIHIARLMLEAADVLVLDEPTNDLDIPTLEVLEEALEDFPGALILVTHDRAMLERLATSVLAIDGLGEGGARMFASVEQALAAHAAAVKAAEARDRAIRAAATKAATAAANAATPPAPVRKKLAYKEQREYDAMEANIAVAEAAVAKAEARVNDPGVLNDHTKMGAACHDLEDAQGRVAELFARWEELEAKQR